MAKQIIIPPPEQRLCRKHGKPIMPSQWKKRNRTTGCSSCGNGHLRSPESRNRRQIKWENIFISCIKHDDRRCNKSCYVSNGRRKCNSCRHRRADGTRTPHSEKNQSAETRRNRWAKKSFNKDPLSFIHKQMKAPLIRLQRMVNA
jgi:hypothetical protein